MGDLGLVIMEPDKAYVSDMLWLPKKLVAETAIKQSLEYWDVERGQAVMRKLWDDTKHHIVCPREFLKTDQYPQFPFPFIELAPKCFPKTNIWTKHDFRDDDQVRAWQALSASHSGILNLACGKGKTVISLKKAEQLGCPTLVVVHNSYLMNQWINDAIPTHVELPFGQKIGVIQGERFEWQHPIVVAMIHTLAARAEEGKIPDEFLEWFGLVIFDEVHHLSAPLFVTTAPLIRGIRLGLTATDLRSDGTDFIYKFHIGDVFYSDLKQNLIPRIYFQETPVYIDLKDPSVKDIKGEVNHGKLRTVLGGHDVSNQFRAYCIREALSEDRKVLCVGHSKDQLKALSELFPDSGLIIQETNPEERTAIVKKSRVTFAIASLGFEGLDDPELDMAFVLTPFKDPGQLQQVMGRIQRPLKDKKQPVLVIFDDVKVRPLHGLCNKLRAALKEWDKHSKGHMQPLEYTTLKAPII